MESVFDLDKLNKSLPLCLTAVHDICCIVEPSSPLTTELVPFLPTLFRVWMAGKESDCLVRWVKRSEREGGHEGRREGEWEGGMARE